MSDITDSRGVLDSFAMYFPYFSDYNAPKVQASNGVTFWRHSERKHWYTTAELARYTADGDYTPCAMDDNGAGLLLYLAYRFTRSGDAMLVQWCKWYNVILKKSLKKLPPHQQNNINRPTAKGVCAAIDRIYNGYMETIRPGERESFVLLCNSEHHDSYTPKITRLDTALDLPPSIIPTPDDLLYYVRHGRGSGARYIKVAARQGIYIYDKKIDTWYLIRRENGKTKAVFTRPYFMRSLKRLKKALLTNEITIYIGTRNGEIKIYRKGGLIRYELSAKKSILRKLMPDRRIAALSDPFVLSHLFFAAAERIGELFRRSTRRGLYLRAVRQAIGSFIRNFVAHNNRATGYYTRPAVFYNNVILFLPRPLPQKERPPPFLLMTAPISEQ